MDFFSHRRFFGVDCHEMNPSLMKIEREKKENIKKPETETAFYRLPQSPLMCFWIDNLLNFQFAYSIENKRFTYILPSERSNQRMSSSFLSFSKRL